MFICNKCLEEGYENKPLFSGSNGRCEICEKHGACWDIHSSRLIPKQPTKPMEKTLKMSVETARQIYKDYNFCMEIKAEITSALSAMYKMVMENFTKEELEPKKGFTWEESVNNNDGFYIEWDKISNGKASPLRPLSKCLFKTEKQALSALAFAQLTYICAKYNEGKDWKLEGRQCRICYTKVFVDENGDGDLSLDFAKCRTGNESILKSILAFKEYEDAKTSLEVNSDLWRQYFML